MATCSSNLARKSRVPHVSNILLLDEYKVRNPRVNAIFKNTLFEMMARDFRRRIGFTEVRRRLSLQHFIVVEEGGRQ